MLLAFVLILLVGTAIAVPVGIHLSNNNKKSVPTNTPEPGGTGQPVPPIVTPRSGQAQPVPPQSGQPPPVQPIVPPPPVTPQSGQAPPVPPSIVLPQPGQPPIALPPGLAPPIVTPLVVTQKKYTYEQQPKNNDQLSGCPLKDIRSQLWSSELSNPGLSRIEKECGEHKDCVGYYYDGTSWLVSTNKKPADCVTKSSSEKFPFFYLKKETAS
jgi:hypothetical protein